MILHIIRPCTQLNLNLIHDVGKQYILFFRRMQSLVGVVIKKRVIAYLLLQRSSVQHVGMEQQSPSVEFYLFSIVFFPSYLSRCNADDGASALIVIFSTTILQVNRQVLVHEYAIHAIVVQTMTYGRESRIIDDSHQGVMLLPSKVSDIVISCSYL